MSHPVILKCKAFLEESRNEVYAAKMSAYMKNRFSFYGVNAPQNKLFFKQLWAKDKVLIKNDWKAIVEGLWQKDER